MEKIVIEKKWQSFFDADRFAGFDDFFRYTEGELVNQNRKRDVIIFKRTDGDTTRTFYMKRFFNPHFKDILFTIRNFGKICSQAELEWLSAGILLEKGIETYYPVGYGYRSVCGIERQSFFITEEINGPCLLDYLMQSWEHLSGEKQENLVIKLACFFKRIHTAGISLPDSYIWHLFMVESPGEPDGYKFGIIDLHRMRIRTRSPRQAAMNLGRFLFSLPEGFMDTHLRWIFMNNYCDGEYNDCQKISFIKNVDRWRTKLLKRRKKSNVDSITNDSDKPDIEHVTEPSSLS